MSKPTEDQLRAAFEAPAPMTVGVEEEVMLLDAETLDLAPRAPDVLAALGGDPRFKLEMPAAHLEIVLPPLANAAEVAPALLAARRSLVEACAPLGLRPAAAGVHPFAAPLGELNDGPRYASMLSEFGDVARAQLVCALQVHVAVRPADGAMAVYNALRPFLPLLAALAANAPIYDGRDTGLASIRPAICTKLPQQGLPPELSWRSYAESMEDPARWWWELRPHPSHGTLEVRVPDAQATVSEAAGVVAVVHALVAALAQGAAVPAPPEAELEARRVAAYTSGTEGSLGAPLRALLDALEPVAEAQGAGAQLRAARDLVLDGGGAARRRAAFASHGARGVAEDLADRFGVA